MPADRFNSLYRGRPVLVTGHTGFKGSWLCAWLRMLGAQVTGFALAPEAGRPSLFDDAGIGAGMNSAIGDIRDLAAVERVMAEAAPEIVFHLAAQPLVRRSYRDPIETFGTNVMGTAHVLDAAARQPSVRAIVVVTTDKCYENKEWDWGYREIDRLGGKDPYSQSKACAELVSACYATMARQKSGAAIATARGGNVIGGGDWSEDRLIPDIVRAFQAREKIVLRNPAAIRPWQHVLELARGYLMLGARLFQEGQAFAGAWNFGPGRRNEIDVVSLTRKTVAVWGETATPIEIVPSPLHEAGILRLDTAKAESQLAWRPLLDIDETIEMTVAWYRQFVLAREPARALLDAQLIRYAERVI